MAARVRKPKVTKADLDRLADLARTLGLEVAAIEATPGKVRLVTTAGKDLTVPGEDAKLEQELAEYRAKNGGGEP